MAWAYTLAEDLYHLTRDHAVPWEFQNERLTILHYNEHYTQMIVRAGYAWDGCTCAFDAGGTKWASCLHDAIYQFDLQLMAASGWSMRQVLSWGDEIFLERMLLDGANPTLARIYYRAVCAIGYRYHVVARWWRRIL